MTLKARPLFFCGLLWLSIALSGCATQPTNTDYIAQAEAAVMSAEQAEAGQYAPRDLRTAKNRLAQARGAVEAENYGRAAQRAEESQLHARLASAKVDAAKAREEAQRMQSELEQLREELLGDDSEGAQQ